MTPIFSAVTSRAFGGHTSGGRGGTRVGLSVMLALGTLVRAIIPLAFLPAEGSSVD
jgi:hypothetical protein